jgi:hypothetical protein
MRPRFSEDRGTIHSLDYHLVTQHVSYENIIEISFYNTIPKFINNFLAYLFFSLTSPQFSV